MEASAKTLPGRFKTKAELLRRDLINTRRRTTFRFQRFTAFMRVLPDFLIIGAQKCGTSSLYTHLGRHPNVCPAFVKEVRFFNNHFQKELGWYRAHFPSRLYKGIKKLWPGNGLITGEGEPSYLPNPIVPSRVFERVPSAKFIVMLRNPVDRAYSQYHHRVVRGHEDRSFEAAVAADKERLKNGWEGLDTGNFKSLGHAHYSYLPRGLYADQLKMWMDVFPKDQFLIICAEDFFADTQAIYNRVLRFLGLPDFNLKDYKKVNTGKYKKDMAPETRKDLAAYFLPHNQRLYADTGIDFHWDEA